MLDLPTEVGRDQVDWTDRASTHSVVCENNHASNRWSDDINSERNPLGDTSHIQPKAVFTPSGDTLTYEICSGHARQSANLCKK